MILGKAIKAELVAKGRWDEKNGDRRSHLFCVGVGLDGRALRARLDAALQ